MGGEGSRRFFCRGRRADVSAVIHEGLLHSKPAMEPGGLGIVTQRPRSHHTHISQRAAGTARMCLSCEVSAPLLLQWFDEDCPVELGAALMGQLLLL